jgi:acetyl-CoA acyltransferase
MARAAREVFFVDGVRTPFGKAGPQGQYWRTRADDLGVKVVRELLRRNPSVPVERIGDVAFAATAQVGDQGLTLGRDVALLAGLPDSVPGFAVDRMCAGALTAVTAAAGEIAFGAVDVAVAGGVEHMGHHPMGDDVDFNPRFVSERLIDESAAVMGQTAENLHDLFPAITKERADAFAVQSQRRATAAWQNGVMKETVVPLTVFTDDGWKLAERDEFLRPETSLEGLAQLKPAFRAGGRVTAGNSAGLTDGATASFLAAEDAVDELALQPRLRLVGYAYAGVAPHLMGMGPVPATRRVLEQAGIALDDVDLFELNEPFAVQVLTWCDELGVAADDPRLNPYGGAIACGHPLAATGIRLISQLAYGLRARNGRYGLTALCIGMGMGCAILWENTGVGSTEPESAEASALPTPEQEGLTRPSS